MGMLDLAASNGASLMPPSQGPDYMPMLPQPKYGDNPWALAAQSDGIAATQGVAEGQRNLTGMATQYQQMAAPEPYPSFPNSAGLGSQKAFQSASSSAPPVSSQGVSPWSFQGEAMSR